MPKWKNGLIQLLNIAGTGPIFGPIMGALYGPVHDYMIGMISLRNNGAHLPELASRYLGKAFKHVVNIFSILLLMLVGTVFVTTPANLINSITPSWLTVGIVTILIFAYYIVSTILPIDKAMGKVYPMFGAVLIISTLAIGGTLLFRNGTDIPNLTASTLQNFHPGGLAIFPALFFTISCGALSGFHATQAPLVSRTSTDEREGRFTFYGMMIAEGVIAMIWAAAAMTLFDGQTLHEMINAGTASLVVNEVSILLLGSVLGMAAINGVIVLPISSGLSAFRSLRNIVADYLNIDQDTIAKILAVAIPLYVVSFFLTMIDFNLLWRYFNWANQVTAVIALFVSTRYLYLKERNYFVTLVPGTFILYAVIVYILSEPIGFSMGLQPATYIIGAVASLVTLSAFWQSGKKQKESLGVESPLLNDELPIGTFSSN